MVVPRKIGESGPVISRPTRRRRVITTPLVDLPGTIQQRLR
jgi:hypothetical protein